MNELLSVAKLGRVVGLKGALKLHNLSDFKEQFKKGACFLVKAPSKQAKKQAPFLKSSLKKVLAF